MVSNRKSSPGRRWIGLIQFTSRLAIGLLASGAVASRAQDGPPGITMPTVFAPFNPNAPACSAPPGLAKVLAFAQDNEREFMQGVDHGLAMAAQESRPRISARARQQRRGQDDRAGPALLAVEGRRGRRCAGRSGVAQPQPAGGHLVGRLCRHDRAAAGDVAAQCAAIPDRQGAGRCGGRLHQGAARRQSQRRPADPGQPASSSRRASSPCAIRSRTFPASPSSPTSRPIRSTRRAASRP